MAVFEIKKRYLHTNFWPKLNDAAYASAKPPYLPYTAMATIMNTARNVGMVVACPRRE